MSKFRVYPTTYAFSGGPLSNWTKSPFRLNVVDLVRKEDEAKDKEAEMDTDTKDQSEAKEWQCAEQAIMAAKAVKFDDMAMYKRICAEPNALRVKQLGSKVAHFDSAEWDKTLERIMPELLLAKYAQHEPSRQALLETGNRTLVEASKKDKKWGIGMLPDDERVLDASKWQGKNLLGKWLTQVREAICEAIREVTPSFDFKTHGLCKVCGMAGACADADGDADAKSGLFEPRPKKRSRKVQEKTDRADDKPQKRHKTSATD